MEAPSHLDAPCARCYSPRMTASEDDSIGALASPVVARRDQATREVVAADPGIATRLLEGIDLVSPSERARRIYTLAGVYLRYHRSMMESEARLFDLKYRGPIAGALRTIAEASSAGFAFLAGDRKDSVEVDLREVTLLEALDRVCGAVGAGWARDRYGTVRLDGAPSAGPTSYHGPSRSRIASVRIERSTDFANVAVSAAVRLRTEFEWPLNPMMLPMLKLDEIVLSPGGAVTPRVEAVGLPDGNPEYLCTLANIPRSATHLERLEGAIVALFPTGYEELTLETANMGDVIENRGLRRRSDRRPGRPDDDVLWPEPRTGVAGDAGPRPVQRRVGNRRRRAGNHRPSVRPARTTRLGVGTFTALEASLRAIRFLVPRSAPLATREGGDGEVISDRIHQRRASLATWRCKMQRAAADFSAVGPAPC